MEKKRSIFAYGKRYVIAGTTSTLLIVMFLGVLAWRGFREDLPQLPPLDLALVTVDQPVQLVLGGDRQMVCTDALGDYVREVDWNVVLKRRISASGQGAATVLRLDTIASRSARSEFALNIEMNRPENGVFLPVHVTPLADGVEVRRNLLSVLVPELYYEALLSGRSDIVSLVHPLVAAWRFDLFGLDARDVRLELTKHSWEVVGQTNIPWDSESMALWIIEERGVLEGWYRRKPYAVPFVGRVIVDQRSGLLQQFVYLAAQSRAGVHWFFPFARLCAPDTGNTPGG